MRKVYFCLPQFGCSFYIELDHWIFFLCPPLIRSSVIYVQWALLYTRSVMPVPENEWAAFSSCLINCIFLTSCLEMPAVAACFPGGELSYLKQCSCSLPCLLVCLYLLLVQGSYMGKAHLILHFWEGVDRIDWKGSAQNVWHLWYLVASQGFIV